MRNPGNPRRATLLPLAALLCLGLAASCASTQDVEILNKSLGAQVKRVDALEDGLKQAREANAKLGADLQGMREDVQTLSGKVDELAGRRGVSGGAAGGENVLPALTKLQNDVWDLKVRAGLAQGPPPAPLTSSSASRSPEATGLPPETQYSAGGARGPQPTAPAPSWTPSPPPVYLPPQPGGTPYTQPPQPYGSAPAYPTAAPAYPQPGAAAPAPAPAPATVPAPGWAPTPAPAPSIAAGTPPQPPAPPAGPPAATASGGPEKGLFDEATKLFDKKQWQPSREKFAAFLKKYPSSDLADNAHYWIGETYYNEGKYDSAFLEFEAVVNNYPKSDKACDARLKEGLSYKSLQYNVDSCLAFQSVLKQCPGTDAAERAKKEQKLSCPPPAGAPPPPSPPRR